MHTILIDYTAVYKFAKHIGVWDKYTSSQGKLFLLASARRHQIQEAHKIGKIDFMTPKMAIKTILLTRLRLQKQKSSLVYHISPEICKDAIL